MLCTGILFIFTNVGPRSFLNILKDGFTAVQVKLMVSAFPPSIAIKPVGAEGTSLSTVVSISLSIAKFLLTWTVAKKSNGSFINAFESIVSWFIIKIVASANIGLSWIKITAASESIVWIVVNPINVSVSIVSSRSILTTPSAKRIWVVIRI